MTDTPTPGPAAGDPPPADLATTARHAFRTAGALRGLVELLAAADWKPDGYTRDELAAVADTINGLSIRLAIGSADAEVLSDVTGRNFVQIGEPFDAAHLAALQAAAAPADGETGDQAAQADEGDPDAWRRGLDQWRPDNGWSTEQWGNEARALREALRAVGSTFPACLPGEPKDCGDPLWVHYATWAAMLQAQAQIMVEANLGADTPGGKLAHTVYHAELAQYRAEIFGDAPPPPGVTRGDEDDEA